MHAVRKHILATLKETGGATVADLAEKLEMAPVSVRHHLDILQGDNLIRVARVERNGSVGRPQQIYVLTAEAGELFPNNFAALAAGVVRQMKHVLPPEQVRVVFASLAHEMVAEADLRGFEELDVEERLDRVASFLSQRGYLARWEVNPDATQGGYLLHKHNCPYAGVSGENEELCMMDQLLVNELVGQSCCRVNSVARNGRSCTYQIGARGQEIALFV